MPKIGAQQAYNLGRETYMQGREFDSIDFKELTDIEFEMAEKGYRDAGGDTDHSADTDSDSASYSDDYVYQVYGSNDTASGMMMSEEDELVFES